MAAERALLMVWDGLRPDFVTAEQTPNLWRLIQRGVWFERSAHMIPWEEPGKTLVSLLSYVRPLAQ